MKTLNLAVVGLGHRGRHMIKCAKESFDNTKILAACDIHPVLWHETQYLQTQPMKDILPGTEFFESYDAMLEKYGKILDLIIVETGADVHADFCIKALNRNINVFSDIPSVSSLDEARRLWEAERASRARLMTGANANCSGFANALANLYQKGLLGELYYMEVEYVGGRMGDLNAESLLSKGSNDMWRNTLPAIRYCTHSLGPMLRCMKEDLRTTICLGTGSHFEVNDQWGGGDDIQSALFQTESQVTIRLLRSRCNGRMRGGCFGHHSWRGWGTNGYFERMGARGKMPDTLRFSSSEIYGSREMVDMPSVSYMPNEYVDNPRATGHGGADYAVLDQTFQQLWKGSNDFTISLRDGLRMTLPGIYADKSAQLGGRKLTIHYPWEAEFVEDIANYNI